MSNPRIAVAAPCAAAALAGGILAWVANPSAVLLACELLALSALALICGFTGVLAALRPWIELRSVRGTLLVMLGLAAPYVPTPFLFSAMLLALGVKQVWLAACERAEAEGTVTAACTEAVPARMAHHHGLKPRRKT